MALHPNASKQLFCAYYGEELRARYEWAKDLKRFVRFGESVARTIDGHDTSWNHRGEAVDAAWKRLGGKGHPTLKALRALPYNDEVT